MLLIKPLGITTKTSITFTSQQGHCFIIRMDIASVNKTTSSQPYLILIIGYFYYPGFLNVVLFNKISSEKTGLII